MFKFNVTPDDGPAYEVVATTRDVAKWERTTKGASLAGLQSDMKAVDLYRIAYHASVRQGLYAGTLADFEDSTDLDVLDLEDPDPTRSAA
ncbi:hypothetical protein [Actinoplanes sp. NPDC049802]|uniref:hypothetical protein n=1 Tax=Actinoplanes sp. NPDC049802 TaxID=3154742 RepID=UPI0034011B80